ncbi:MAG: M12 family metallopeptidase [Thiotrichaceae bacterium]|nr:M12 family metallopeptidase [Thiotrichaceae bacterium]
MLSQALKQFKYYLTIPLLGFSLNSFAADLPELGAGQAVDGGNQTVQTTTTFKGGFALSDGTYLTEGTISATEKITISGEIQVAPEDVGKQADIVVYVKYAALDDPNNPVILMLDSVSGQPLPWTTEPVDLEPYIPQVTLEATHSVDIFSSLLLPESKIQLYFGYLTDTKLVVNQQPINMTIESIPELTEEIENIDNQITATDRPMGDVTPLLTGDDDRFVGTWALRWPVGSTLKVGFKFEGANFNYTPAVCYRGMSQSSCETAVADAILQTASTWSQYGNIYFRRAAWENADIRITFQEKGGYSYLGTWAKRRATNQETMNLAFSFIDSTQSFRRTVLHEFGHALGIQHEHISPNVSYNWNEAQIIAEAATWGWSEDSTRFNIIENLLNGNSRSAFLATAFDPKSIMIYSIPKSWVSIADQVNPEKCPDAQTSRYYCVGWNTELSETDKQGIAQFYPRKKTQTASSCSYKYDPSNYRPNTENWDGHQGKIAFNNPTSNVVKVTLYHPDYPNSAYATWDISARINVWLYYWGTPINASMDWGIKVNDSPICILKTVSSWKNTYFQASSTQMPGH